jgi:hypothetical protein
VRGDTHNSRHRLWYYFTVRNAEKGQKVLFTIPNLSKGRSSYRDGMSPVVKSRKRPTWQRLPQEHVLYYRAPRKRHYCLSFFFVFDDEDDDYSMAYAHPYSYTDLQRNLHRLDMARLPWYHRAVLCRTPQQRCVDVLTITAPPPPSSAVATTPQPPKRTVVISARIHPGETPAQFIMAGLIDFLTSADRRAARLRETIVFKVGPASESALFAKS